MAKTAARRRIRSWSSRSGRSISYGPFARFSDWWCAGRDAKRPLPDLVQEERPRHGAESTADIWHTTPRMVMLAELGRGRMEAEWIKYKAEVHDEQLNLSRARAQRAALDAELALAREELEHAPPQPSEDELSKRVGGERHTDISVVRQRRLSEHARRRHAAKDQALRIAQKVRDQDVEIARLGEPIRVRFEVAQARAAMVDAYVKRRSAAYLTRLIRKHPQGSQLNHLLGAARSELPAWTSGERSPDVGDLPTSATTLNAARLAKPALPSMEPEVV
jgi:hypothetical protein